MDLKKTDPCVFEPLEEEGERWCTTHRTRHCWRHQNRPVITKRDVDEAFQRGLDMGKNWWAGRSPLERYVGDPLPYCPKLAEAEKRQDILKRATAVLEQRNARRRR